MRSPVEGRRTLTLFILYLVLVSTLFDQIKMLVFHCTFKKINLEADIKGKMPTFGFWCLFVCLFLTRSVSFV